MFDAVTMLADVYVQLCESGCYKYLAWKSTYHCNLKDGEDAFTETISRVREQCMQMEKDLSSWKSELDRKRAQFPYLNYYTIRQLLLLQTELESVLLSDQMSAIKNLPAQIFRLLDETYPEIEEHSLRNVLEGTVFQRHWERTDSEDKSWEKIERIGDKFHDCSLNQITDFIASLEEANHDNDAAKAATMQCGISDRSIASAWACVNEENEELINKLAQQMDDILDAKESDESTCVSTMLATLRILFQYCLSISSRFAV